jgi:transcriptional regulator with XRE-family HTH domain
MINQLSVADQLRSARQRAGLTQLELAERLGIGRSHVSDYETGGRPEPRASLYLRWLEVCRRAKKRQRSGRR